jgi:hypothetical protein
MSDTPRTDSIARDACDDTGCLCRPELLWEGLKRLERELAEMKTRASQALDEADAARRQRDQWRELAERAVAVLPGICDEDIALEDEVRKLKEESK